MRSGKTKGAHAPDEIPVALLARMAVDRRHQGKGLGAALLRNALLLVISSSQLVAFRAVVVEAADEKAKKFYEHFGFIQIKGMDMKLVLSTADILQSSVEACDGRDCC
ncbi:Acetyltransferase (GNAT) domain-containing protein [Bartonella apis]|uniref:GNAT family N-acetyltransferase n=1 Tax=Bartonella apis TaxID=1686310 RepID=UPI000969E4AD|nr:GNAT family N-acetyltransferase [Bartonella apis]OLY45831.1 Acetyltransferase (GNAT) domain-containing protein [Bartonella apis]